MKQRCEMDYWEAVSKREHGTMSNSHYKKIYTDFFGIDATFYDGKKFLDVGCGPRGSLEWAKTSVERVCVDPLARKYGLLGADAHDMVYVQAGVEEMPFPDNSFDVIAQHQQPGSRDKRGHGDGRACPRAASGWYAAAYCRGACKAYNV